MATNSAPPVEVETAAAPAAPSLFASLAGTAYVPPAVDPPRVTRFMGPVLTGTAPPGMALAAKRVNIDTSKGADFIAPVTLPVGSILLWVGVSVQTAFAPAATAKIGIGITSGGAEISALTAIAAGTTTTITAPLISTVTGGTAYFNYVSGGTITAGKATAFLIYLWPF